MEVEKTMTDIEQNMDETLDMDVAQIEVMNDKQDCGLGNNLGGIMNESSQPSQAETEDDVDGYSSDFQLEEARGYRCLPTT